MKRWTKVLLFFLMAFNLKAQVYIPKFDLQGHRGARGSAGIEELAVDGVVAAEVIHVDEIGLHLDEVRERASFAGDDVPNVLDHGARLNADVEHGRTHSVGVGARDRVVGATRARA